MVMMFELVRNKIYIVIGSNGGLGFEVVKYFVFMGVVIVVMVVCILIKGEIVKVEIEVVIGCKEVIKVW